jgi:hypothetical protein
LGNGAQPPHVGFFTFKRDVTKEKGIGTALAQFVRIKT